MIHRDKLAEAYLLGIKKIHPDYHFSLGDRYADHEGNELTFGQIFKAGYEAAKAVKEVPTDKTFCECGNKGFFKCATTIEALNNPTCALCGKSLPPKANPPETNKTEALGGVSSENISHEKAKEILLKLIQEAVKCAKGQKGLELELHVENIIGNIYPDFGVELYKLTEPLGGVSLEEVPDGWICVLKDYGLLRYSLSEGREGARLNAQKAHETMANVEIRPVKLTFLDEKPEPLIVDILKPLTMEEAEKAYDEAPEAPLSEEFKAEVIRRIVEGGK